jgi:hypothetical protein
MLGGFGSGLAFRQGSAVGCGKAKKRRRFWSCSQAEKGNVPMKSEIVQKLQTFLGAGPLDDDCRVVYFLVQIRKLLERSDAPPAQNKTLRFYCNWALHVKLDRNRAAEDFLAEVDPILTLSANLDKSAHDRSDELLTLRLFRSELRTFLSQNGIDTATCDADELWDIFLRAYSNVVENCEIESRGSQSAARTGLQVSAVSIMPVRDFLNFSEARTFPMEWGIRYTDGRRSVLSLSERGLWGATVVLSD